MNRISFNVIIFYSIQFVTSCMSSKICNSLNCDYNCDDHILISSKMYVCYGDFGDTSDNTFQLAYYLWSSNLLLSF